MSQLEHEPFFAPGGTNLKHMAKYMGFSGKHFKSLNPALLKDLIPNSEKGYWLRIPKGHLANASQYIQKYF